MAPSIHEPPRRLSAVVTADSGVDEPDGLRRIAASSPEVTSGLVRVAPADSPEPLPITSHMLPIMQQDAEDEEHVLAAFGSETVAQAIDMEQRVGAVLQIIEFIPGLIRETDNASTM